MTDKKLRKVGIMGGTFDPIHIGHLILGENAWRQFGLETVLFMLSANPPHKKNRIGRASVEERMDMVALAIKDNPHFTLSCEEAYAEDYCYTADTLKRLNEENPDTEYYFIMGADSLFAFETWKNPAEICRRCVLVVAIRDHVLEEKFQEQIDYLSRKYQVRIEVLSTPNLDVSSNDVRKWLNTEEISLRYYVPDSVINYIKDNNLYSGCEYK